MATRIAAVNVAHLAEPVRRHLPGSSRTGVFFSLSFASMPPKNRAANHRAVAELRQFAEGASGRVRANVTSARNNSCSNNDSQRLNLRHNAELYDCSFDLLPKQQVTPPAF